MSRVTEADMDEGTLPSVLEAEHRSFRRHGIEDQLTVVVPPATDDAVLLIILETQRAQPRLKVIERRAGCDLDDDIDILRRPRIGAARSVIHNTMLAPPRKTTSPSTGSSACAARSRSSRLTPQPRCRDELATGPRRRRAHAHRRAEAHPSASSSVSAGSRLEISSNRVMKRFEREPPHDPHRVGPNRRQFGRVRKLVL